MRLHISPIEIRELRLIAKVAGTGGAKTAGDIQDGELCNKS